MTRAILVAALLASGSWAAADEVWLKGGGRIVGEILERRAQAVVVDVGPGTVTLPMVRVERIVSASSTLTEYRSRAGRLAVNDVDGWIALAMWADGADLRTQAREAWHHVLSIQPASAIAHQALGDVLQGGTWMSRADAMRAQGLIEYQGQWMSPGERETRLRVEAAEAAALRDNALADARVAEAEARAREAEARARSAEADAVRAEDTYDDSGGIPLIGYGAVGFGAPIVVGPSVQPCCGQAHAPGRCPNTPHHPPAAQPTPVPRDGNRQPSAKPNPRPAGPKPRG